VTPDPKVAGFFRIWHRDGELRLGDVDEPLRLYSELKDRLPEGVVSTDLKWEWKEFASQAMESKAAIRRTGNPAGPEAIAVAALGYEGDDETFATLLMRWGTTVATGAAILLGIHWYAGVLLGLSAMFLRFRRYSSLWWLPLSFGVTLGVALPLILDLATSRR
jgi:hypothetical protein